jgi:23S rRNA-/tRNA-specific pseudouridylate synthase
LRRATSSGSAHSRRRTPGEASPGGTARIELPPILYEDEALMALNKPAGLAVHGGSGIAFGAIERLRQARPTPASSSSCIGWTGRRPACCSSRRSAAR